MYCRAAILGLLLAGAFLFAGCETTPGGESAPRLPGWLPFVPDKEEPEDSPDGWKSWAQAAQAKAGAGFTIAGAIFLAIGLLGQRNLIGVGAILIAVGVALFALNEAMDHWLWPWFALFGLVAFVAWKVKKNYRRKDT